MLGYSDSKQRRRAFSPATGELYRAEIAPWNFDESSATSHGIQPAHVPRARWHKWPGWWPQLPGHPMQPPGTVGGANDRLTEQGADCSGKYANPKSAAATETFAAATLASYAAAARLPPPKPLDVGARTLECQHGRLPRPGVMTHRLCLTTFQRHAHPRIVELNIGSRPASARPARRSRDRAPFRGASAESSAVCTLPGGLALVLPSKPLLNAEGKDPKTQLALVAAYVPASGRFFRTLLSSMDMVLAKSDLALASRYSELADRRPPAQEGVHRHRS